jgi:glycosyltransferase
MKTVYIYDDWHLSYGTGVGTFLKEFARCATQWGEIHVCMVMFRTNVEAFCVRMQGKLKYFLFPKTFCHNPFEECEKVCSLLRQQISDTKDTIFLFNYVPCDKLMHETRRHFPLSKQICVIHDFNWTAPLQGDVDLFQKLITETKNRNSSQYAEILKLYRRETEQYQAADHVICLSEDTHRVLRKCYNLPNEKITFIPHGADMIKKTFSETIKRKWKQTYYLNPNEKVILMAGRISKGKGSFAYLDAFKEVLKTDSDCRLVIAGDLCNAPELLEVAGEIVTKITLTGQINERRLSHWYRMANIGILPSYSEQCSYVGLEMMSYGLPVVASDGFGVRCMFQDGINACVASIGNRKRPGEFVLNLADCTLRLLSNPTEQKKLKDNARRILKEKYNFSMMDEHYKAIFMA